MTNAIVRNAKAKIIERRFRDVKDHLSRLFDTFTGGNENFGTDAEKNTEGKDDGTQYTVKPLPEQRIRCYPVQQAH